MQLAGRIITLAISVVLILLGAAAALTLYFSDQLRQNRDLVLHTHAVMEAARLTLSAVQDAETGQRGYLLTERNDYLEPYDRALAELPGQIQRLHRLVSDNPKQTARVDQLENAVRAKTAELARVIETARRDGFARATTMLLTDEGKRLMDQIRRITQDMIVEEDALLAARTGATDVTQRQTLYVAMGGSAIALVVLLLGGVVLLRSNDRLRDAEADIVRHAGLLQSALDNTRDGIAAFDGSGGLVAYNRHFFSMLEFPETLAQPGSPFDRFQAIDRARAAQIFDLLDRHRSEDGGSDAIRAIEIRLGAKHLECYRCAMPGGGFLYSCNDLTKRKQAEDIARQAQKIEAVGQLTGGVAHDFNNLLQVIRTNLDLIGHDLAKDSRAAGRLRNALTATERGARLTAQLLAFARRQPLEPRAVNLGRLVGDMTELLRRTLGERVEVEAVVAGGLWNTLVDPVQVENGVLNLAINARDAMPEGGKLTIELANAFLDEAYAAGHAEVEPGQYVMLAVTDTGRGMTPEVMAQAFEPFFTTKPENEGTGLGLSQVYGFVKQSGGHIKIYSELGQGTTIKLYLPRVRRPEDLPVAMPSAPAPGGTETVLVVEDDPGVRQAVSESLADLGYRVLKAENADAALTILSSGAAVDLLFTDVVMPGTIKTRDMTRRAKELIPTIGILYTSGYTENSIIHDGRLDDDVILLSKPYTQQELARRVRAALARAGALTPVKEDPPADPPPAPPPGPVATAEGPPPAGPVLIVEDDALIRLGLVDMLHELAVPAVEAGNGEAALRLIDANPAIVGVILDLGLPDMRGEDLAAAIRARRATLPIVVASGQLPAPILLDGAPMPRLHYLQKPYDQARLKAALRQAAGLG